MNEKFCPSLIAKDDAEYQKKRKDGAIAWACDYRDPKGGCVCGSKSHTRAHHKQAIVRAGGDKPQARAGG